MIDLKPCPFCGGEAKPLVRKQKGKKQVSIKCKACNARSGVVILDVWEDSAPAVEDVAKYWNRRTDNFVRCKDCHYNSRDGGVFCEYWCAVTEADAFCNKGERRREINA